MQQYISAERTANSIRMKRPSFGGAFLVVEGSRDNKVYKRVVDLQQCRIQIAHDRERVLRVIAILNDDSEFDGSLGIIDADFDHLSEDADELHNVLRTDLHDLECMMLDSPALDRVLDEYANKERVAKFAKPSDASIAAHLASNAAPLGCLRLISLSKDIGLKFEGLTFSQFVDRKHIDLDIAKMVREVANNSQRPELDQTDLVNQVKAELAKDHECWQISCGHDVVELLAMAIKKVFSGKSSQAASPDRLEQSLRLAYDPADLRATRLMQQVRGWESKNAGYHILLPA